MKKGGLLLFLFFVCVGGVIAYPRLSGWKVLEEAPTMGQSRSEMWWLNSGGLVYVAGNAGQTIQGSLPEGAGWRMAYARSNPEETENGKRPQNIFRLVAKASAVDPVQSVYFKVNGVSASSSAHRDEANGLLLFSHYMDSNNLYYAGIRVDGNAVIKKKQGGVYQVLAERPVFGRERYDKVLNPLVFPENVWMGVKSEVTEGPDAVRIRLFLDANADGQWVQVLEAVDREPVRGYGHGGIRTDFMDVQFREYNMTEGK